MADDSENRSSMPRRVLRVLVVDDNIDVASSLAMLLRVSGHEVREAYSAESALEAVADFTPDIAFLDLTMPDMDGHELARRLRRLPLLHNTPLVALTGYGRTGDVRRTHDAGFCAHLVKPVHPEEVDRLLVSLTKAN